MVDTQFTIYITNEGIAKAREVGTRPGWHLTPSKIGIASTRGAINENRTYASMDTENIWYIDYFSGVVAGVPENKLICSVVVPPIIAGYTTPQNYGELYFIYEDNDGNPFLYGIGAPNDTLTWSPGVSQQFYFTFTLNNTEVGEVFDIVYTYPQDIEDHNRDISAHDALLRVDGTRNATDILSYNNHKTFLSPYDIVSKEYVDNSAGGHNTLRNIGEIITSTIPLTDAGLHLLDGGVIDGNGTYRAFVDYIAELYENLPRDPHYNFDTVGTIINEDGILSGFNLNNYAKTTKDIPFIGAETWELHTKVKFDSFGSNNSTFIGDTSFSTGLAINTTSSGNLMLYLGTSGWDIANGITSTNTVLLDTWYYIRVTFDGTQYLVDVSEDNETWVNYITLANTTRTNTLRTVFGCWSTTYMRGSIDINESFIIIDDEIFWSGVVYSVPCFCTEEEWQQSVTNYGVCGKFVYDPIEYNVRLPKVEGFIEGADGISTLGNVIEAGLPNITGGFSAGTALYPQYMSGAFYDRSDQTLQGTTTGDTSGNIGFDASYSNSIYGNSDTVQPQATNVLYYIVIATIVKTEIQVDIDRIATDLNSKLDKSDLVEVECIIEASSPAILPRWYLVYSNGFCRQGGVNNAGSVTLTKRFIGSNYTLVLTNGTYSNKSATSFTLSANSDWIAEGYITNAS